MSELDQVIAPEIKDDEFYFLIQKLARELPMRHVLEIGSSAGGGSTEAFVSGLKDNPAHPLLFCLEVSKPRFEQLSARYTAYPFVRTYHASSIPVEKFLTKDQVRQFYQTHPTGLNQYPLERVLGWLDQDIDYVQRSGAPQNGIEQIKRDHQISFFDLVLIDGSAFTGDGELDQVYGAHVILLDDVNDIKCLGAYQRLKGDSKYKLVHENWKVRNGYAMFRLVSPMRADSPSSSNEAANADSKQHLSKNALPVHFFTIVVNGEPFIRHHIEVFKQLPFTWHWHIIEGIAALTHCTGWSVKNGARITDALHTGGRSNDGTSQYLDQIAAQFTHQISIYRKPSGAFWDGKLEMVNAPLAQINAESVLVQVDADELWTVEQLTTLRALFLRQREKTAAYFFCNYYVGENLAIATRDTYGNNSSYEWLRAWRFIPGSRWQAHEPPVLCAKAPNGSWIDIAKINPIKHAETEAAGLVFDHFAYTTESQLRFKEHYYGYSDAVSQWRSLQECKKFPAPLRQYFAWVTDPAQVNTTSALQLDPIATKIDGTWRFRAHARNASGDEAIKSILLIRPDLVGDNVLAMSILPALREKYRAAEITVVCQDHIADLYRACPHLNRVVAFNRGRAEGDERYLSSLLGTLQQFNADLALCSVYSPVLLTHVLTLGCGARKKIALRGDTSNVSAQQRDHFAQFYTRLIDSEGEKKNELDRNRDFIRGLGIAAEDVHPIMWLNPEQEAEAERVFTEQNLDPQRTVALFAGFDPIIHHDCKTYYGYGKALDRFCSRHGLSVLALGAARDAQINQRNLDDLSVRTVNLCGKTDLMLAAALLKRCRLALGADTGIGHLACALKVPNVILVSGAHMGRFFPYTECTSVVALPLDCYGCSWKCTQREHHCVKAIDPSTVSVALEETFKGLATKPRIFEQAIAPNFGGQGPRWQSCERFIDLQKVQLVRVHPEPEVHQIASAPQARSQAAIPLEEYWQDCQILKERCEDSPGILLVGHGDSAPTPERLSAFEKYHYFAISSSVCRDDATSWIGQPRCLGALLHNPQLVAEARRVYPQKVFERLNCVMNNFFRTTTQQPSWMATLAGLSYTEPLPAELKTIDVSSCWTSVPLKRTELVVEAALLGNLNAYIISQEYGTRREIVDRIDGLAKQYGAEKQIFYFPFEHYAVQQIGQGIIIDGRPIGINNGVVASIIDKTRVYLHTSETEGIPNSILEALMRNVPVVICRDILGPLPELARDLSPGITLCDPHPKAILEAVQAIKANYRDYAEVGKAFRAQFDPFAVSNRLLRHCQNHFAQGGLPWKGQWQGLTNGMCARFNLAREIPAFEQATGQLPVYPNMDLVNKYMAYQHELSEQAQNEGAVQMIELEHRILTERYRAR